MRIFAACCYLVGFLAEAGGLVFALLAFRNNRKIMLRWRAANPSGNPRGSAGQLMLVNQVVTELLDEPRWRQRLAVTLIAFGIVAGLAGNFAGLPA